MSGYLDYLSNKAGYKSYSEYLKGEHWTIFSGGMRKKFCFCCEDKENRLQVHHITYERLGQELPNDVITVCDSCHVCIHELTKNKTPLDKAHIIQKAMMADCR